MDTHKNKKNQAQQLMYNKYFLSLSTVSFPIRKKYGIISIVILKLVSGWPTTQDNIYKEYNQFAKKMNRSFQMVVLHVMVSGLVGIVLPF